MTDIADRAGVSRTTVSFVLNDRNRHHISDETRRRVLEAAQALDYRPNATARALVSQRSGLYGLVTEIVTAPYAVDVIKGAQRTSWDSGRFLLIAPSEDDPAELAFAVERLLEQRVEGLLFAATWHRPVTIPDQARTLPCVLVNCFDPEHEVISIVPDEVAGGRRAARALLAHGHRRIGHITLEPGIPAQVGRLQGFREELAAAGAPLDDALIATGDGTAEGGYRGALQLLTGDRPPTALFCGNDRTAMGAYDALRDLGLDVPGDISIIGFDDQELISAHLRPGLTTVALPFTQMGTEGVNILSKLTAGSRLTDRQVLVDCPLITRSSVGDAPR
ncbi:LacI family DNA-binding transcriptional regulator [Nesterenkonia sp. CL21]|uniref:LacI family DNA-binding transcriptional regulator n=1 Tax=unclassified Nesterenkonia TaxID=2629769 RepID=UPI00287B4C4F|nr:LacI family DNA-binding transcriptional regulator [Nesterenkonia sp. CL21]MDS2173915.1 LacI family DNA-binding transcriptional regulator [Nesterenkonia sp. CL21]